MKRAFLVASLLVPAGIHAQSSRAGCTAGVMFEFQVDVPARFIADSTLAVRPTAAVPNPANLVQFVVDTEGRVAPSSFRAIKVTDRTLVDDARKASEGWRYRPAQRAGRVVCQLVQTPVAAP